MPVTEEMNPGGTTPLRQDASSHGLIVQGPTSTRSSETFSSDDDQQFGPVHVWRVKMTAAADQAYDAAAAITNVFGSTKIARNETWRIIGVRITLRVLRTGGSPNHEVKVQTGNGAATEVFTDLVATRDIDGYTVNLPVEEIVVNAETVLLTGETIRCQFKVSGTTTTGTAEVDVDILAVPAKA